MIAIPENNAKKFSRSGTKRGKISYSEKRSKMGRKQVGRYHILGGRRLCGTVKIQGSKNAALPMIAAAVLTEEEVVLERCPRISDVEDMAEIVRSVGGAVWW